MTTWTIAVDWDRNGDYSSAQDDVTNHVVAANWFLGMRKPYQDKADNASLTLTLDNTDRLFSPENASSPLFGKLVPQRPVRIQSNDGTTTRTHWVGWIDSIQPVVGRYGARTVELVAVGAMQFLKATETALPLQRNRRTDEVIADLIKEVVIPPALNRAWVLGRTGGSELTASTYLATTAAYSDLETGVRTLGIAADNWVRQGGYTDVVQDSFDVYRAIGDVTAAERGRFFFDREGKAVFWNRHHLLQGATPLAAFDDSMTGLTYSYAGLDALKNEVTVIAHPRTISASADDVLWKLDEAVITVEASKPRTVYVKYDDEANKRVGAEEVTVNNVTFEQGTAAVTVKANANGAELTFTAAGGQDAVVKTCEVRGRKIVDSGQMEAKSASAQSIMDYGRRALRLNLPSVDTLDEAAAIAGHEQRKRSQPRGLVQTVTLASHGKQGGAQHDEQLARTLGDLITVKETQTGHEGQYHVIGEAHELSAGATLWKTTWYLEPAEAIYATPSGYPWKLGVSGRSNLSSSAALTY